MAVYRVEVTRLLYVVARDARDAENEALMAHMNSAECHCYVTEANETDARCDRWDNVFPYNGGNLTVSQLLKGGG